MAVFGILKPNKSLTDVEEIFIQVAQNRGHQAYIFTAKDVSFEHHEILGKTLDNGKVVENSFSFPDIIQNRLAVKKEDKEVYLKLAEMIPFTSNRVGTKQEVYKKMCQVEDFKDFLIEVVDFDNIEDFFSFISRYKKVIAKPASSNQGKGIYTIEKLYSSYRVRYLTECSEFTEDELATFFKKELRGGKSFNFSPFFVSETNVGQTTVFRMHITRGALGKWQLIKTFPYVNLNAKSDITNGMQGALITTREQMFLEQYYPESYEIINTQLKKLFNIFIGKFQRLYPWRLDALGLDLGISQEGKIVIYEVNAGPGVGFMAYPVACAQVQYYEWLAKNATMPCVNNFLPMNLR